MRRQICSILRSSSFLMNNNYNKIAFKQAVALNRIACPSVIGYVAVT